jgi:hypothetical protein
MGFAEAGMRPPLWFWRPSGGEEVDVLIELARGRFVVIECKTVTQVNGSAVHGLQVLKGGS